MRLVFATTNPGKLAELRELLADLPVDLLSLAQLPVPVPAVDEDGDTFEANAIKKAVCVSRSTGLPALADDSGLEVDALGGAPGVHSARFTGPDATDQTNNAELLRQLRGVPAGNRTARFRSVLALADCAGALGDDIITATGVCEGHILAAPRGTGGFGYDPLFLAPELGATFAELGVGTKNELSHRARAMREMKPKLITYFRLANQEGSG